MKTLLQILKDFFASITGIVLLLSPIAAFWLLESCCKQWVDGPISLVLLGVIVGGVTSVAAYQSWTNKRTIQQIVYDPEKLRAFWEDVKKRTGVLREINDAAYSRGRQEHLKRVQETGWLVGIWGAEQGFAIAPNDDVYTWISPNEGSAYDPRHTTVRWHPNCSPPEAVTEYILYCLPEEGPPLLLTKAYVLGHEEKPF